MRRALYWGHESLVLGFTGPRFLFKAAQRIARVHIRRQISDPELRKMVTPNYESSGASGSCCRPTATRLLTNDPIDVIPHGVTRSPKEPSSVLAADGTRRAPESRPRSSLSHTGFHVTDFPPAQAIRGRDGKLLSEQWVDSGMSAYLGTTVHNLPNLFFIVGPNTGLGHTSMVFMIESQIAYVMDALRHMDEAGIGQVESPARGRGVRRRNARRARRDSLGLSALAGTPRRQWPQRHPLALLRSASATAPGLRRATASRFRRSHRQSRRDRRLSRSGAAAGPALTERSREGQGALKRARGRKRRPDLPSDQPLGDLPIRRPRPGNCPWQTLFVGYQKL